MGWGVVGCCSRSGNEGRIWDLLQGGSDVSRGEQVQVCMLCWGKGKAGWVLSCSPQLLPHSTDAKTEAILGWSCRAWVWIWAVVGWRRGAVGVGTQT